jgi:hypothetical protein
MRAIIAGAFFCLLMTPTVAGASSHHGNGYRHGDGRHFGRYLAARHWRFANRHRAHRIKRLALHKSRSTNSTYRSRSALPGPCRTAASMGGPCGCWAAYTLLGRLDHVWRGINLWLANDWLRFPHVAAAPGTAAVWPGRHVAPVVGVNGDGTVTVRDSWATHKVRMAGLVFVQPPSERRRDLIRWTSPVPL